MCCTAMRNVLRMYCKPGDVSRRSARSADSVTDLKVGHFGDGAGGREPLGRVGEDAADMGVDLEEGLVRRLGRVLALHERVLHEVPDLNI